MGISGKRDRLICRARELYAKGMQFTEVAEALGVTGDTVRKWHGYDLERGLSWDKEREQNTRPERVLKLLETRFGNMVLKGEKDPDDADASGDAYEAKLLKMIQIINGYRKSADELTAQLLALEQFAIFCAENLPRRRLAVVRDAVAAFTQKLRKESS
jgi:hypothetical protein